jgi:hypothetical protein
VGPDFQLPYYVNGDLGARNIYDSGLHCVPQPDGRILITGNFSSYWIYRFLRINPDGTLDKSFNADHLFKNYEDVGHYPPVPVTALAVTPDGGIYVSIGGRIIRLVNELSGAASEVKLLRPVVSATAFAVQVQTVTGKTYRLESTGSLNSPNWQPGAAVSGDATVKTLTSPLGTNGMSFYRVRVE